jgi:hypothetical protein
VVVWEHFAFCLEAVAEIGVFSVQAKRVEQESIQMADQRSFEIKSKFLGNPTDAQLARQGV